jgi:hypothetical protein
VHLLVKILNFSAIVMMLDYPGKQPLALTSHFPQCIDAAGSTQQEPSFNDSVPNPKM